MVKEAVNPHNNGESLAVRVAAFDERIKKMLELEAVEAKRRKSAGESSLYKSSDMLSESYDGIDRTKGVLREALRNGQQTTEVVQSLKAMMGSHYFLDAMAADIIANDAKSFINCVSKEPERLDDVLDVVTLAYWIAKVGYATPDVPRPQSAKIFDAIKSSLRHLEQYFKDERIPRGVDFTSRRFHTLLNVMKIFEKDCPQWISELMSKHIAECMREGTFTPRSEKRVFPERISENDIDDLLETEPEQGRDILIQVFGALFKEYGLPPEAYVADIVVKTEEFEEELGVFHFYRIAYHHIPAELSAIQTLEAHRRGAAAELYQQFGIRWFSRYPLPLLLEQYDNRNRTDKPYGVFLTAVDDWNGAFFEKGRRDTLQTLFDQIQDKGYALRVIEAGNREEIEERLKNLDDKNGKKHKISFLFLRAHGNVRHMSFGPNDDTDDIFLGRRGERENVERLKSYLVSDPVVILEACVVGKRSGFAQWFSETFATVIAPPGDESALESVQVNTIGNDISFSVEYNLPQRGRMHAHVVPGRIYKRGNKV
jgi:hypothetical protein